MARAKVAFRGPVRTRADRRRFFRAVAKRTPDGGIRFLTHDEAAAKRATRKKP